MEKDNRVIGWQLDNETRRFLDYGKDAPVRFRNWLKAKYKNIDALNQAWGTNFLERKPIPVLMRLIFRFINNGE